MLVLLAETITFSPQGGVLFGDLITPCLGGGGGPCRYSRSPFSLPYGATLYSSRLGALVLVSSPELPKLLTDVVVFLVDAVAFLLKVMYLSITGILDAFGPIEIDPVESQGAHLGLQLGFSHRESVFRNLLVRQKIHASMKSRRPPLILFCPLPLLSYHIC